MSDNQYTTKDGIVIHKDKIVSISKNHELTKGENTIYDIEYSVGEPPLNVILDKGEMLSLSRLAKSNRTKLESKELATPQTEDEAAELEEFRRRIAGNSDKVGWTSVKHIDKRYKLSWVSDREYKSLVARGYQPVTSVDELQNPDTLMDNRVGESTTTQGTIRHQGLTLMKIRKDFQRVVYQETNKEQNKELARRRKESRGVYRD